MLRSGKKSINKLKKSIIINYIEFILLYICRLPKYPLLVYVKSIDASNKEYNFACY